MRRRSHHRKPSPGFREGSGGEDETIRADGARLSAGGSIGGSIPESGRAPTDPVELALARALEAAARAGNVETIAIITAELGARRRVLR
jgi:hypothetical protein